MHLRDFDSALFNYINFSCKKWSGIFAASLSLEIVWSFKMSESHICRKFHAEKINLDFAKLKLVK